MTSANSSTGFPQLLDLALSHISEGIIILDPEGKFSLINAAAKRMLELEGHKLEGLCWPDLAVLASGNESLPEIFAGLSGGRTGGDTSHILSRLQEGRVRHLFVEYLPVPAWTARKSGASGWILIIRDLTEETIPAQVENKTGEQRRALDQQRIDALASFAQAIAHEIRNPLMVIGGFSRILQRHHPDLEYLSQIISNVQRLEAVVQEVSDYASLPPMRPEYEDPVNWLQELIASYEAEARHHHVNLAFSHTWPNDLKLRFDLLLMRKVIGILFQNALEALEGLPGQITVRIYPSEKYAHLEIEDSGQGIEPQNLAQLFNPFFTTKPKALGMGLTKAERIVAKHGGKLRIEPAGTQGTRVCLDLPLVTNRKVLLRKDLAPADDAFYCETGTN